MNLLHEIERNFATARGTGRMDSAFERWRERHAELAAESLADVIDACRGDGADRRAKDRIYVALSQEATGDTPDEDARLFLLWLLLPGVWTIVHELEVGEADADDVAAELLVGLWYAVTQVGASSRAIAHNVLRAAKRAALRALCREQAWSRVEPLEDGRYAGSAYPRPEDYDDTLSRAVSTGVVSSLDLALLLADAGELRRIASECGMNLATAYKRRDHARARLRRFITESSHDS